jgi:hypothetical protein
MILREQDLEHGPSLSTATASEWVSRPPLARGRRATERRRKALGELDELATSTN